MSKEISEGRVDELPPTENGTLTRLLEIGFENHKSAAVNTGGKLFSAGGFQYWGIELPGVLKKEKEKLASTESERVKYMPGDAAMLDFEDDFFDVVLMRSVFGQFTDRPQAWESYPENVWAGVHEAFRVLKPGGKIVVSEENTPYDIGKIEITLRRAGFIPIEYAMLDDWDNLGLEDKYKILRQEYFNDPPMQRGGTRFAAPPYILIAQKPETPEYDEIELLVDTGNDHIIPGKRRERNLQKRTYKKGIEIYPSILPLSMQTYILE